MPRGARTVGHSPARAANGGAEPPNGMRPLPHRRALPNGRAALGGLLVAAATVLLFSIAQQDGRDDYQRYIVARRPLAIGTQITASDVATAAMRLPTGALRSRLFVNPARLIGAVVVAPVARGELVQASAVVAASATPELRQISVPIEAARALGDRLQPGELVDVVATFGSGADAFTVTVVSGARVVARDANGGPLGDRRGAVVILAIASGEDAVAVAHAIAAGQISLVRVTGIASETAARASNPYRAPRPGPSR